MANQDGSEMGESASVNRTTVGGAMSKTYICCAESISDNMDDSAQEMTVCGAIVDVVENDDGLVEQILAKNVEDRPEDTYMCSNGHNGELKVAG